MNYMTFDGTSCESYGLKLIGESVIWTPAPHKGGMLDIPGGSEPVNYSEFVSGQAEYQPGGDGENARFIVRPTLLGQADTRANRWAIIKNVKRLLHGKTVVLSDAVHSDYSVEAVCSVEVDEQRWFTTINLTWMRQPIRLMSQGSRSITPVWEQQEFDPAKNVLLGLPHTELDITKCGWDYAEAVGANVCVYSTSAYRQPDLSYPSSGADMPVIYYVAFAVVDTAQIAAGNFSVGLRHAYWRSEGVGSIVPETFTDVELAVFKQAFDTEYGVTYPYFDAIEYGWQGSSNNGWPVREITSQSSVKPFLPDATTTPKIDSASHATVGTELTDDLLELFSRPTMSDGTKYGDVDFDYTGYYRWVEPNEDSFPNAAHGMNPAPSPYLLSQPTEPSWYAGRDVSEYGWRYLLVDSVPLPVYESASANSNVTIYYEVYDGGVYKFYYFTGESDADKAMQIPVDSNTLYTDASWWAEQSLFEATAGTASVATSEFNAHIRRGVGGEVTWVRRRDDNNADVTQDLGLTEFGSADFDYGGYSVWDTTIPGMRDAATGDTFELGKVYLNRIESESEGDETPIKTVYLYQTYVLNGNYDMFENYRVKVIEFAITSSDALASSTPTFDTAYYAVLGGTNISSSITEQDLNDVFGTGERFCVNSYSSSGWPTTQYHGNYNVLAAATKGTGNWESTIYVPEVPYAIGETLISALRSQYPYSESGGGSEYEPCPITRVPPEFTDLFGATGSDIGYAKSVFYVTDYWTPHRIYTEAESPQPIPSTLVPTWCADLFRATYSDFEAEYTENVDTGYTFCIMADSTHPCVVTKDSRSCSIYGGAAMFQTDLPMLNGENTYDVNVPFAEVDDGEGLPLPPSLSLYWKRGDV